MATTSATGTSAADAASQQLTQIQRELNRLQQQQAQKKSGKTVQEFEKDTRDVKIESSATARNIGVLQKDTTRLNVFSSLTSGDSVDGFQFRVTSKAPTTIAFLNGTSQDEGKLHYQIFYKSTGRVLADSDPKAGAANTVYQAMLDGRFEIEKGDYILRVSRTDNTGANRNKEYNYGVQLSQGLFTRDYDTVERAARSTDDPYGVGNVSEATTNLTAALAGSVSFLQSLPKIGTSATDKLMGLIINSVF